MKRIKILNLIIFAVLWLANDLNAQVGYFDAPYTRYEADLGTLANATVLAKSYAQNQLQSEASDQVCVNLSNASASVNWTVTADGDGLVVRYCVPDGQTSYLDVYANNVNVGTLTLSTYYSWEYLSSNGNPNNSGVINTNPKMRFDEVRMKLPSKILAGGNLKLVRNSGNIYLDFAELEPVPAAVSSAGTTITYSGNGSDLQTFIDNNGGKIIYMPAGVYNVNRDLYFGNANTSIRGAGMWYTEIHFTSGAQDDGGLWANANNISYSGLYLTTVRNSRSSSYKAINGAYTNGATITNVWAEHFECGAWIAQYNTGPAVTDGLVMSYCRFRNNYADGTNLCKGTKNTIVEHCSYRNNGDDDMAIWPANNQSCDNNTFRYNTSENCWRASGCAIYGGFSNQAHHLLIKDNLEVGLRVGNNFGGASFSTSGMHQFYNIVIKSCGTYNDLFNSPVGAIDLLCTNIAGNRINNVKFSCIDIIDSKNDAIYISKNPGGDGYYNLVFENISINGTGREYPNNDAGGVNGARGFGVLFKGSPTGNGTYCGMSYTNRGGNATMDVNTSQIGSFSWPQAGSCPGGCVLSTATTNITSASTFGVCNNPVALTATTTPPSANTTSYIEFFVDGASIGQDASSPYSVNWTNPTIGDHTVVAVAHYSPSNTTSTSSTQNITVADGIYSTATPPVINGTIDPVWNNYAPIYLNKVALGTVTNAADLSAYFKITRDATNLYILIDVTDDDLENDGGNSYDNDQIELFIDMGNDKSGSYGTNDFAYNFMYSATTPTFGESKHNAVTGVVLAQSIKTGGYIMEVKIPWATLGGAPTAGDFMGFDLHVDDDDGGGTRDAKKSWEDATDNAWQWPSVLGTLQIAGCSNPLPVELLSFTGESSNEVIILNWTTIAERNNKTFVIERSANLSDWEIIGETAGSGNSTSILHYNYIDQSPLTGLVYYRLRQVDLDGAIAYSDVVVIQTQATTHVNIAPNPFEESFTIKSSLHGNVEISIYDVLGRLVYQANEKTENGTLRIQPDFQSGAYLLTLKTETFIEQLKIIKR